MKRIILNIFGLLVFTINYGQSEEINVDKLLQQERVIWNQLMQEEITTKQWYKEKLNLGHYDDGVKSWFRYDNPINILNKDYQHLIDTNSIHLVIPENHQIQRLNGDKYIKLYLLNLTDSIMSIPRIDATIGNFSTEILIDNKWMKIQRTKGSTCGNSYWTGKLNSKSNIVLNINNGSLLVGDKSYFIRYIYQHFDNKIISNSTIAKLNKNQIARIKYQNKKN